MDFSSLLVCLCYGITLLFLTLFSGLYVWSRIRRFHCRVRKRSIRGANRATRGPMPLILSHLFSRPLLASSLAFSLLLAYTPQAFLLSGRATLDFVSSGNERRDARLSRNIRMYIYTEGTREREKGREFASPESSTILCHLSSSIPALRSVHYPCRRPALYLYRSISKCTYAHVFVYVPSAPSTSRLYLLSLARSLGPNSLVPSTCPGSRDEIASAYAARLPYCMKKPYGGMCISMFEPFSSLMNLLHKTRYLITRTMDHPVNGHVEKKFIFPSPPFTPSDQINDSVSYISQRYLSFENNVAFYLIIIVQRYFQTKLYSSLIQLSSTSSESIHNY